MASSFNPSAAGGSFKTADVKPAIASTSKFAPVKKEPTTEPAIEFDEKEIERILNAEATTLQREEEVRRLLAIRPRIHSR